jgi:3-hydroxyacyl-CoA dehydrogenase
MNTNTVTFERVGAVALIHIDRPPVNAISHAVRSGVADGLARALSDSAAKAILITSGGRTFMAGADLAEFSAPPQSPTLQELQAALEDARLPVVVAIQGLALGGGLEFAMAAHYRMAAADAKLGLPEITLGLIPGAGGTQRLPRLVGSSRALDMMLGGAPIAAADALHAGLVDEVADGDLRMAALAYCERLIAAGRGPRRTRDLAVPVALDDTAVADAKRAHVRTIKGLSAADYAVTAVRAASEPFPDGIAIEARLAARTLVARESLALRHLFFAERAAGKVAGLPSDITPLRSAAVVGAGTMGSGIAQAFADAGVQVTLIDSTQAGLSRGLELVRTGYANSVKRGRLTTAAADERTARITGSLRLEDAAAADVVIEAVFEDLAVKTALLGALDGLVPAHRLIATNTSTLSVTGLARSLAHPEQLAGLHFFSPANVMKLLEIIRGADTAPRTLATALQVSRLLKKIGVVAGDGFGFIGNRMMLDGYFREAELLLLEGAAISQLDAALEAFGFAMGPQKVSDLGGTDVGTKARTQLYERETRTAPYFVIADTLTAMGRLGQKTGAGFYRYAKGDRTALSDPDVARLIESIASECGIMRRPIPDSEIVERCVLSLINVGAQVLDDGVAARAADIDVVWTNGYGFPRYRGGPMFHADTLGLAHVLNRVRHYHHELGPLLGHYWKPAPLLERLGTEDGTFERFDLSRA